MKKKTLVACMLFMLATTPVPIMAASLDDIVTQQEVQAEIGSDSTSGTSSSSSASTSGSVLDDIAQHSDMSKQDEMTAKIASPLYKVANIGVQLLFYIIMLFMPVQVLADLGFIVLPIGRTGNGNDGMQGNMQGGMHGGMSGYGGGYGSRYGGMGGGYSGYGGGYNSMNNGMNNGMNGAGAMGDKTKFLCIPVSENVVQIAYAQDTFGNKMKTYFKDAAIKAIFGGACAVLFVTGVTTRLAIVIGNAAGNALASASGMI